MPPAVAERLEALARLAYPFEACGILIGDSETVAEAFWAANLEASRDRFRVDPNAILAADHHARRRGLRVIGFWHSHPDASPIPSIEDVTGGWSGYAQVLVAVDARGATAVRTFSASQLQSYC